MSVFSHLHQLFNAEQCQAYIHTLRWKDRPLQCPRCQSHHIGHWGSYQYRPGCKRYWCQSCKRTFNDLTATLLHQSKRPLSYWILATFLLCLACSSRRIAREVGVHVRTSYRWCWWLRNAALSYQTWPRHPCQQWGLKTTGCARVPDRVLTSRTRLGMLCCITYCSDCSFQRKTSCRVKSRRVRVSSVSASLMS